MLKRQEADEMYTWIMSGGMGVTNIFPNGYKVGVWATKQTSSPSIHKVGVVENPAQLVQAKVSFFWLPQIFDFFFPAS